ncbi:hypothetical protein ACIQTN_01915 [Streptomyces werraensis]|uniref:hypothetical protein n=1 Tax=Streptomyces werraensis TaxID=68284 RepID=UPI0038001569
MNIATDYADETLTLELAENFFRYMDAVLVSDLTATERIVALAYAKSYNWKNESESRCGIYRIAAQTGLKETAVKTAKSSLEKKGWLSSKRRFGMSNLTVPTLPSGFSYENAKAQQDALVNEQNEANKARVKKVRKTVAEKQAEKDAELEAMRKRLAELEAQEASQEAVKETGTQKDQEAKPVPQKATQSVVEASEAYGTDLAWETKKEEKVAPIAPVAEKKVEAPKKARNTKKPVEKVDPMQAAMEQVRRRKAIEAQVVEDKLNEADNPVRARELFNDESWKPETTDKVQRAALAALFSTTVEEDKELVTAKSFEMEW